MARNPKEKWLVVFVAAVGLLVVGIPRLRIFKKATATLLHPDLEDVLR